MIEFQNTKWQNMLQIYRNKMFPLHMAQLIICVKLKALYKSMKYGTFLFMRVYKGKIS